MASTASAGARLTRQQLWGGFVAALVAVALLIVGTRVGDVHEGATHGAFWLMAILAVLAGVQSFVEPASPGRAPAVICPTVCITFAILLGWGLGPAVVAQLAAVALTGWRLHRPALESVIMGAIYTLSFAAASLVLWIGQPDPFQDDGSTDLVTDAVSVVAAIGAWLLVYAVLTVVAGRLQRSPFDAPRSVRSFGNQLLFKASLLLLSPVLALAAHINIGFVPLIFVPLYAVQRMARLSADRDRAARLDPLTELANRTGLKAGFTELLACCERMGGFRPGVERPHRPTLFMLDLDRFKHVNDALGHDVGDQLLVAVARRIEAVQPSGAMAARLGGDEFAVLAATRDAAEAEAVGRGLVRALAEPITLDGLRIDVTASVGVATLAAADEDFSTLLRRADLAMYDAKRRGDSVDVHVGESTQDGPERLGLLNDLRDSLAGDAGQIVMHYQPQVALATGEVEAVEALLRWWHPRHGSVEPQSLLDVVEHTSVMQLLTRRVIDDVVAEVARWSAAGRTMRASLNISARDLYSDDLVPHLATQLVRHQVPASLLQIEITESALLADPARAQATVARIADLGVALSLDDFGTGYSSLQHLRKLPIAEIKIDRTFVAGMADNHDDAAIVRSTIGMARSLGIRVVAEGVENQYTHQLLAEAGCDLAQGFFTGGPMPGVDLGRWLAEQPPVPGLPARSTALPGAMAVQRATPPSDWWNMR